jgi:hypothetical protein
MSAMVGPLSKKKQANKEKDQDEVVDVVAPAATEQSSTESESCYQKVELLQVS